MDLAHTGELPVPLAPALAPAAGEQPHGVGFSAAPEGSSQELIRHWNEDPSMPSPGHCRPRRRGPRYGAEAHHLLRAQPLAQVHQYGVKGAPLGLALPKGVETIFEASTRPRERERHRLRPSRVQTTFLKSRRTPCFDARR
jgi:hypothetical protein